ncbi:hypothetical protein RQM65_17145 [Pricia sp. S334]|uniref:DUF1292 domain-containing protein n=1 Tax=Pricia mediterranea TaxID=3076079 RepID=A0ABU3L9H9_9FLAO|nr:hypothetical protein [Pricia sp. S334]MDT7830399.1 hypothetical protein [Pricia sp. S334]
MLRKIVDYKKLDHELALLLIESYPDGYGDEDIVVFKTLQGDTVEAVEIKTEDTVYLVKISKSLSEFISNFDDTIEKELEARPQNVLEETDSPEYELDSDADYDLGDEMD